MLEEATHYGLVMPVDDPRRWVPLDHLHQPLQPVRIEQDAGVGERQPVIPRGRDADVAALAGGGCAGDDDLHPRVLGGDAPGQVDGRVC